MHELYINYGPMFVLTLLGAVAWTYRKFLADKIKSQRWSSMILRAGLSMRTIVVEVNAVYVDALKKANEDGVLTRAEREKAREMALDKFKEQWGVEGLKELAKIIGFGDALDSWLGSLLESTIKELPKSVALPPKN